jgi:hypothetical protein
VTIQFLLAAIFILWIKLYLYQIRLVCLASGQLLNKQFYPVDNFIHCFEQPGSDVVACDVRLRCYKQNGEFQRCCVHSAPIVVSKLYEHVINLFLFYYLLHLWYAWYKVSHVREHIRGRSFATTLTWGLIKYVTNCILCIRYYPRTNHGKREAKHKCTLFKRRNA